LPISVGAWYQTQRKSGVSTLIAAAADFHMSTNDLVGVYITDRFIDLVVGHDSRPDITKLRLADLQVVMSRRKNHVNRIPLVPGKVVDAFGKARQWIAEVAPEVRSIGVGCYGPFKSINVEKRDDPDGAYGCLQRTTHNARLLSGRNIVTLLSKDAPWQNKQSIITVVPDVSAAATGELYYRATKAGEWIPGWENEVICFIKTSVGVGGAVVRAAEPWKGRLHPEIGQIRAERWRDAVLDPSNAEGSFKGVCRFHSDCLEGLMSVLALEKRWHPNTFEQLERQPAHACWERQAHYMAQLCIGAVCFWAPKTIVLGGRVMNVDGLLEKTRTHFRRLFNTKKYKLYPDLMRRDFITTDWNHDGEVGNPGVLGALCIAAMEARENTAERFRRKG
jgi:predicted NBD/HSP70 family sugar kinase